jgi:hypothetical protein
MSTQFPVYDTATLIEVVPNLKLAQNFLLDKFFPNEAVAETEEIAIDVDVGKRRLAPFVSPLVEGKLVEGRRVQTNVFKPAYIKDKRALDLRRPIRRQIGERIGGAMSPAERYMANIQFEMADAVDMINRRLEWMAAQALLSATVTVTGDGFPSAVIDFGRDSTLTLTLSGGAQWGQSGVSPSFNIQEWQNQILKLSGGVCTDLVFTPSSWQQFILDPTVKQAYWYPNHGGPNDVDIGAKIARGAIDMGRWGQYKLWIYNDWYVDPVTDNENPMIPDGTVIMAGPDLMGTRAFGVIMDPAFAYGPLPYAPKMWVEQDPAQTLVLVQSAPLVIPSRVNACFAASVCAPVLT